MKSHNVTKGNKKEYFVYTQLNYLKNHYLGYRILMVFLAIFEIIMIARGLIVFDFSRWTHVYYFVSYIVLFLVAASIFFMLIKHKPENDFPHFFHYIVSIFSTFIIIWSTGISYVDSIRHTYDFIVFYTVVIAVAGLAILSPYIFCSVTIVCGVCLYILSLQGTEYLTNFGTIFNYLVLIIMACFINIRHYRVVCRQSDLTLNLEKLSYVDQLTNVNNRRMLDEELEELTNSSQSFSFGLIDIDDFKHINDEYGHEEGDEYLIRVARLLSLEFGAKVYRYGGDEFAIVTSLNKDAIKNKINKINQNLNDNLPDKDVHISAGFCHVGEEDDAKTFFKNADEALYKAKSDGKKTCAFFNKK